MTKLNLQNIEFLCNKLILDSVYHLDRKDLDAFTACFTADGELYRPGKPAPIVGRSSIQEAYAGRPATRTTRHICTNVRCTHLSEQQVLVTSYIQLYVFSEEQEEGRHGTLQMEAVRVGEFEDICVLEGDELKISKRTARFVALPRGRF